jgi:hypothetical protein
MARGIAPGHQEIVKISCTSGGFTRPLGAFGPGPGIFWETTNTCGRRSDVIGPETGPRVPRIGQGRTF